LFARSMLSEGISKCTIVGVLIQLIPPSFSLFVSSSYITH
jgi:hypothetical protein